MTRQESMRGHSHLPESHDPGHRCFEVLNIRPSRVSIRGRSDLVSGAENPWYYVFRGVERTDLVARKTCSNLESRTYRFVWECLEQ